MKRVATAEQRRKDDAAIRDIVRQVNDARNAFEESWSFGTLALVDPELHQKLTQQLEWFHESSIVANDYQAIEEGQAALRGLALATDRMNAEDEEVMIWSEQLGAHLVVKHHRGQDSDEIVITPAEIVAWLMRTPMILDMKRRTPGCEIANVDHGQKIED